MVFDRQIKGRKLSFGVSGLLYQSDVLMYDRETESLWSQLAMKAVSGAQAGAELHWISSEHMTWRAWREAHPEGKVLSTQTGYARDYSAQAYASYEHSNETMFPVKWSRQELSKKTWVVGIVINSHAKAYALDDLTQGNACKTMSAARRSKSLMIWSDAALRSRINKRASPFRTRWPFGLRGRHFIRIQNCIGIENRKEIAATDAAHGE